MAITSGFFNSRNGDRTYDAEQMSSLFGGIITDGVFKDYPATGNHFKVTKSSTERKVTVGPGRAWFRNVWINNDNDYEITFQAAPSGLERADALFFKIDKSNAGRIGTIIKVEGTPAPSGEVVGPDMTDTDEIFYYRFCLVRMGDSSVSSPISVYQAYIGNSIPYIANALGSISLDDIFDNEMWTDEVDARIDTDVASYMTDPSSLVYTEMDNRMKVPVVWLSDVQMPVFNGSTSQLNYDEHDSRYSNYSLAPHLYPSFAKDQNVYNHGVPKLGDIVLGSNGYYATITSVAIGQFGSEGIEYYYITVSGTGKSIVCSSDDLSPIYIVSFWGTTSNNNVGCDRTWNQIESAKQQGKMIRFRWTSNTANLPIDWDQVDSYEGTQFYYGGPYDDDPARFLFVYNDIRPHATQVSNFRWTTLRISYDSDSTLGIVFDSNSNGGRI